MSSDNAHPTAPGIKLYLSNFPTQEEVLLIIRFYLECLHKHEKSELTLEQYISSKIEKFEKEVKQCMLLNNYYWAVWSFIMLKETDIRNDLAFTYHFAA